MRSFSIFGHGRARRLLAITQGGIENDQFVSHLKLLFVFRKNQQP